ncbi:MAG: LCP family protein [Patescibacteria group bacterium]
MKNLDHLDTATKINLLNKEDNSAPKGKKIFKVSRLVIYLFVISLAVFAVFGFQVIFSDGENMQFPGSGFFKNMGQLLLGHEQLLAGEQEDRINILMLGNGGHGHDGANLTDTIMLASYKPSTQQLALISVPRDLLVDLPGYGQGKINNAYAFAEAHQSGSGGEYATEIVSNILDLDIHYFVQVDFQGFEDFIDDLGGIDVYVDRTFTDYQYPTYNYKYQVVHFEEGWQQMTGEEALKFVRSRHGNNGESGDFSRSRRQQKVIQAVREKLLSYKFFLNPKKISSIISTFSDNSSTNMEIWEIVRLARLTQDINNRDIFTLVLDDGPNGFLYGTKFGEASVLRPVGNSFSEIQFAVENIFIGQHEIENKNTASIEIKNGTKVSGLAYKTSLKLQNLGYEVEKIGNAPSQDYDQTFIYDLTGGQKQSTTEVLETIFKVKSSTDIPDWVAKLAAPNTEFYVIIGSDNANL